MEAYSGVPGCVFMKSSMAAVKLDKPGTEQGGAQAERA
jgi:hypothetical protein